MWGGGGGVMLIVHGYRPPPPKTGPRATGGRPFGAFFCILNHSRLRASLEGSAGRWVGGYEGGCYKETDRNRQKQTKQTKQTKTKRPKPPTSYAFSSSMARSALRSVTTPTVAGGGRGFVCLVARFVERVVVCVWGRRVVERCSGRRGRVCFAGAALDVGPAYEAHPSGARPVVLLSTKRAPPPAVPAAWPPKRRQAVHWRAPPACTQQLSITRPRPHHSPPG